MKGLKIANAKRWVYSDTSLTVEYEDGSKYLFKDIIPEIFCEEDARFTDAIELEKPFYERER